MARRGRQLVAGLRRLVRGGASGVLWLLLVVPTVAMGPLSGKGLWSHEHHGASWHLHVGEAGEVAQRVAQEHAAGGCHADHAAHAGGDASHSHHTPDGDRDRHDDAPAEECQGLLVSVPDQTPASRRGVEIGDGVGAVAAMALVNWSMPAMGDATVEAGDWGVRPPPRARHLCGVGAVERLVRTSGILLI